MRKENRVRLELVRNQSFTICRRRVCEAWRRELCHERDSGAGAIASLVRRTAVFLCCGLRPGCHSDAWACDLTAAGFYSTIGRRPLALPGPLAYMRHKQDKHRPQRLGVEFVVR